MQLQGLDNLTSVNSSGSHTTLYYFKLQHLQISPLTLNLTLKYVVNKAFPHLCIRNWYVRSWWFYWRSEKVFCFVFFHWCIICLWPPVCSYFKILTPSSPELSTLLAQLIAPPPSCVVSAVIVCRKKAFSTNESWSAEVFCRAQGDCLYSPGQSQSQS